MNMRWDLDSIYTSFDAEDFQRDFEHCNTLIEEMQSFVDTNINQTNEKDVVSIVESYIHMTNHLHDHIRRIFAFCSLSISVDAKNNTALKYQEILSKKLVSLTEPSVRFSKWLSGLENLAEVISRSQLLQAHAYFLTETVELNRYRLSEKEETLLAKLKNTGSSAWSNLQGLTTSQLMIDFEQEGEIRKYPLSVIRSMAHDPDPSIRRKAYEVELAAYERVEEVSAACLNAIKGEVITLCKTRGYKSPLEMSLISAGMDQEALEVMLGAMKEALPDFHRYLQKKASLLGHREGLPFYDLFAPMGSYNRRFSYEEARDYIVQNFRTFSDSLADFAENAFAQRWIDAEPRQGKRGGAFCSGIHGIGECRVLTNFNGNFSDVTTLAHELGHGYHGHCLKSETAINSDYPMPLAETASIFCETIVFKAALKSASREEQFTLLETSISDATQVIVDIYSRFLFESALFAQREECAVPVAELKQMMLTAQEQAYGTGLHPEFRHPYMWVNKPHYYYAGSNFYNYPYAFGQLFAIGLYAEYLRQGNDFIHVYDRLLQETGKHKIADVVLQVGIDIKQPDFWRRSLQVIREDIEHFLAL